MRVTGIDETRKKFTSTVALVTSAHGGIQNVMSAEWSLRVSLEPYLVAVFVGYKRGTYELIRKSGEFGLNYCSDGQVRLSHIAGRNSIAEGKDKWSMADFETFKAKHIAAPLIEGCIMNLECSVVDEFRTGDHAAFIGKILEGYTDVSRSPLVYHGGEYYRLGEHLKKPPRASS